MALCLLATTLLAAELLAADAIPRDTAPHRVAQPVTTTVFMPGAKVSARWATVKKRRIDTGSDNWRVRYRLSDAAPPERSVVQAQFTDAVAPREFEPAIRVVNQLAPLDPFDDPFGDHSISNAAQELPPPPVQVPTFFQPEAPGQLQPAPGDEAAPQLPAEPEFGSPPVQPTIPCDRVYNERNCCESEALCKTAQEAVLGRSIRDISVDITPLLTIAKAAEGDRSYEQERALSLAEAPSRLWRNQSGDVVADGRLVDYRDGRIAVRQSDGETVQVPFAGLSEDDSCFVIAWWGIPAECRLANNSPAERNWMATTMTWKASALCHKPLYFEDVQLERYGHTAGPVVQPVLSGAHFFMNVATLPYQMGINPPNECQYALGYYRPGNCAPWLVPPIPLSVRGALTQAGAVVGGVFVLP